MYMVACSWYLACPISSTRTQDLHFSVYDTHSLSCRVVLKRKRSRSSASSGDFPSCPAEKRTMDEYMKMKMDLVRQDMKSLRTKCDRAIRLFYHNATSRIIRLLEPHLDEVKKAANFYLRLGLHEGEEQVKRSDIQSAESVSDLLSQMSIEAKWNDTSFLQQAVDAIPPKALEREVAEAILSHYNLHLNTYEKATLLKDDIDKRKESENKDEGRQVVAESELALLEITSSKSLTDFTYEDCHHLQVRVLSQTFGIPAEKISCLKAVDIKSTTVTFRIPNGFTYVIMQRSTQLETVWILLELDVIEVAMSGFTFKPSVNCFLTLLRESKPFTADLLGVTEVWLQVWFRDMHKVKHVSIFSVIIMLCPKQFCYLISLIEIHNAFVSTDPPISDALFG